MYPDLAFRAYLPENRRRSNRLIAPSTTGSPADHFWVAVEDQQEWIIEKTRTLPQDAFLALEAKLTTATPKGRKAPESALADPKDFLLRCNHRPSPIQSNLLGAILEHKTGELTDIDYDILRLQLKVNNLIREMKSLEQSRTRMKEGTNFYRFLLSPVRLLPPEILVRIFRFTLEPDASVLCNASSPLGLSHVCSAWRGAVLSYPRFWNRLHLRPDLYQPEGYRESSLGTVSTLVTTWFNRASVSRALSLSLELYETDSPSTKQDLFQSVTLFSTRLSELSITLTPGGYDVLEPFFSLQSGNLPALEVLTLAVDIESYRRDSRSSVPEIPPISVFEVASRLREVYLQVPSSSLVDGARLQLPWNQLNHLEVSGEITLQAFAKVIFQCPQLHTVCFTTVNLEDNSDPNNPVIPPHIVTFPHLKTFTLQLSGKEEVFDVTDVLATLELPSVETLKLVGPYIYEGFPLFSILPGISEYLGGIRSLLLIHIEADLTEVVRLVSGCTRLQELTICIPDLPAESLLRHLLLSTAEEGLSGPVLSQLTSFSFTIGGRDRDGLDAVGEAFSTLVTTWVKDTSCRRPLKYLSLNLLDDFGSKEGEALLRRVQNSWRRTFEEVRPLAEIELKTGAFTYSELATAFNLYH